MLFILIFFFFFFFFFFFLELRNYLIYCAARDCLELGDIATQVGTVKWDGKVIFFFYHSFFLVLCCVVIFFVLIFFLFRVSLLVERALTSKY